ncbi:aldo/keto reductase [Brachybacterium sp. EF45031]|uniref:aldo/keto reductase n=1 Tax=Brachybacterium sillae TaxID=2810536 RepID=UPI00217ED293|nr:aldo/keto reductase [Brachybacterium sillae]MCS6711466.1 aldo/keto reductase [Brachybacterium sillae]
MRLPEYTPAPDRYDTMPYRRAGRSGVLLPAIALGLWHSFGESHTLDEQRQIVRRAVDLGITHFDLANNYGPPPGAAEATLGRILKADFWGLRDELFLSTKAGYEMWPGPYGDRGSRKHLLASLDQSLTRLGVDYVDVFYHHRTDADTPLEETMGALAQAVTSGKALYVGISNYSPERTRQAARVLQDLGTPLLLHQPSYSMFTRQPEQGLLQAAAEVGAGVAVFSPLQQGLLTSRYLDGVPEGSRATQGRFLQRDQAEDPLYRERAQGLAAIAEERGQTLAQMALAWVLRRPEVTTALIGVSRVEQLEENVEAARSVAFTDDELEAIDEFAVDGTGRR